MTPELAEYFKNLLKSVRPDFERIYRGVDPYTQQEKRTVWPDNLDLLDHGIAILEGDHRAPRQEFRNLVADQTQSETPTILKDPK